MLLKKWKAKNHEKWTEMKIFQIRLVFGYSFFGGICLSRHQFEMSIKFWVFNTHIDIFNAKILGVTIALFASL